jgi:hypothetical protein
LPFRQITCRDDYLLAPKGEAVLNPRHPILFLALMILLPFASSAIPITGNIHTHYSYEGYGFGAGQGIQGLLGHLPEDCIEEIAIAEFNEYFFSETWPSMIDIPVPVYSDGGWASETEILFVVRFGAHWDNVDPGIGASADVNALWESGPGVGLEVVPGWQGIPPSGLSVRITSYAFRPCSVGAAPLDFGQLKTLFE